MSRNGSFLAQRTLWTAIVGLAAAAFWVVAVGVGPRDGGLQGRGLSLLPTGVVD